MVAVAGTVRVGKGTGANITAKGCAKNGVGAAVACPEEADVELGVLKVIG